METRKSSVLMMTAPAVGALLVGALLLGRMLLNTTDKFSEAMKPTGYVTVSVVRDGNEIYHSEQHNLITNAGMDFIAKQLGDTLGLGINGANYIALTTDSTAPAATDTTLTSELTTNGLARTQGTYAHTPGTDHWTASKPFTAHCLATRVQDAGLLTA